MHLASLTLRGFKSFASSTTLRFEPGITVVVGPNGSGKSNVVDAIAWVLGEQGAKSLRGGKMEDVIFAGTAGRPALGRAEVVLTIDNSDGALPIDFSEVTISRTMFRNGGSDYAINGSPCRLLDVQELLSDSGIGREMHVIVGQGQLDAILHAAPEERRGFIEEAAGVLKHRKRKEKALRKLEAMQANLNRLQDLTNELRRQLKPLGQQAEVARRAERDPGRPARLPAAAARRGPLPAAYGARRRGRRRDRAARAAGEGRGRPRRGHAGARPSSMPRWPPRRRGWRGPRRPGTAWPACASGCAARRRSRPSGSGTSSIAVDLEVAGRDPQAWQAEVEAIRVDEAAVARMLVDDRDRLADGRDRARPARGAARRGGPRAAQPPGRPARTAARAGSGCRARSTRCAPGRPRPATRSAG